MAGTGERVVAAGHDEADEGLEGDADHERVSGADFVGDGSAEHGAGDVEEVDDCVPAECGGERDIVSNDMFDDGGRVDAEGEGGELSKLASFFSDVGSGLDVHHRGTR